MLRVHSHYENLKVARDAPPESIRAAYRALTRRHHPDRNPGDADAARIMAIVNVAYSVLSDPAKKREHDEWIASSEQVPLESLAAARPVVRRTTQHVPVRRPPADPAAKRGTMSRRAERKRRRARARMVRRAVAGALIGIATLWIGFEVIERVQHGGVRAVAVQIDRMPERRPSSASPVPGWVRSPLAPNGRAWPESSGYVDAYPQLNRTGLSEVTADNRRNLTDMFVKLVSLDGPTPLPVRTFMVSAHGRFTLANITSGTYDLRYRDLATGIVVRTPAFILEEVSTPHGLQHSALSVPLDPPGNGNLRGFALGDGEF